MDLNLPVLPVSISGTLEILPRDGMDLFPGTVTLTIHPPIPVSDHENDMALLMRKTRKAIVAGLARH